MLPTFAEAHPAGELNCATMSCFRLQRCKCCRHKSVASADMLPVMQVCMAPGLCQCQPQTLLLLLLPSVLACPGDWHLMLGC